MNSMATRNETLTVRVKADQKAYVNGRIRKGGDIVTITKKGAGKPKMPTWGEDPTKEPEPEIEINGDPEEGEE